MKFNIIANSKSTTGYDIPDEVFTGLRNGLLCGWSLEVVRDDGQTGWAEVKYVYGMPEDAAADAQWYWDIMGLKPTGNAVFRGYFDEHYDVEGGEFFLRRVA